MITGPDAALIAYHLAVEETFRALRGRPVLPAPAGFHPVKSWHLQGIPLDLVRHTLGGRRPPPCERPAGHQLAPALPRPCRRQCLGSAAAERLSPLSDRHAGRRCRRDIWQPLPHPLHRHGAIIGRLPKQPRPAGDTTRHSTFTRWARKAARGDKKRKSQVREKRRRSLPVGRALRRPEAATPTAARPPSAAASSSPAYSRP